MSADAEGYEEDTGDGEPNGKDQVGNQMTKERDIRGLSVAE